MKIEMKNGLGFIAGIKIDHVIAGFAGRHEFPDCSNFIFENEIANVNNFIEIETKCLIFLKELFKDATYHGVWQVCIDEDDPSGQTDAYNLVGKNKLGTLAIYVSGLTQVTISIVNACRTLGIIPILLHYDRDCGMYVPQFVI